MRIILLRKLFILLIFIGVLGLAKNSLAVVHNIKSYYPNETYSSGYFLHQFVQSGVEERVLWYENAGGNYFKQYISYPYDRRYYDLLEWSGGYCYYHKTHNPLGAVTIDTEFSPPIRFFPENWDEDAGSWSYSGTCNVFIYNDDVLVRQGSVEYTNEIIGWEELAPGYRAIRWHTIQSILYDGNTAPVIFTENWWLGPVPVEGTSDQPMSYKRTMGGDSEVPVRYDTWFDYWSKLPDITFPAAPSGLSVN